MIGGIASCNIKAIVDYMSAHALDYTPGTATAYSNYGHPLLRDRKYLGIDLLRLSFDQYFVTGRAWGP
jgi:hypothetical protein